MLQASSVLACLSTLDSNIKPEDNLCSDIDPFYSAFVAAPYRFEIVSFVFPALASNLSRKA